MKSYLNNTYMKVWKIEAGTPKEGLLYSIKTSKKVFGYFIIDDSRSVKNVNACNKSEDHNAGGDTKTKSEV